MISLFSGVAGLSAHQQAVDVIANNIANINTIGFKAGRALFEEALVQTLRPGTDSRNPAQLGLGSSIGSIDNLMTQGALKATGRSTDMAITGDGFFVLGSGAGISLTRNGSFQLDAVNRLISAETGMPVLGWAADTTGQINTTGAVGPADYLTVPLGMLSGARQTTIASYQGNLDAEVAAGNVTHTSFTLFDSLGSAHQVNVAFSKTTNPGEWTWAASSPDGTSSSTGTVGFDADGRIVNPDASLSLTLNNPNGAASLITLQMDLSGVTQLAGESSLQLQRQDGLPTGTLKSFSVDEQGVIIGVFDNGMSQKLGQIALARVPNPGGLTRLGEGLYTMCPSSGDARISPAGMNGQGKIVAGSLEMSNVDLAEEFANLVITQRGFQANSRIITTGDEMLQELITLKR